MRTTLATLIPALLVTTASVYAQLPEGSAPEQVSIATSVNPHEPLVLEGEHMQTSVAPAGPMTDSCSSYFGRGQSCPPLWTVNQGVRLMNRSKANNAGLTFDVLTPQTPFQLATQPSINGLKVEMSTTSANFDIAGGYVLTVGRYLGLDASNRDDYLEFTYWGLNHWQAGAQASGVRVSGLAGQFGGGSLVSPFYAVNSPFSETPTQNFNFADAQSIEYSSEMHNFEWNLRVKPRGRPDRLILHPDGRWERESTTGWECSYLLGLRFVSYDETFLYHSSGTITQNGTAISHPTGKYQVFTNNDMAGIQIGTDIMYNAARWNCGFRTKLCPAINLAQQNSYIQTTGGATNPLAGFADLNEVVQKSYTPAAFIGDVGFLAGYRLTPNFRVNASYDLVWMTALALAPEQMQFTQTPVQRVSAGGTLLLQGLSLQAELTW